MTDAFPPPGVPGPPQPAPGQYPPGLAPPGPQLPAAPPPPAFGGGYYGMPPYGAPNPVERIRGSWQRRHDSDYLFDFWSSLGWTILSFGIYGYYVLYQLVRRSRDHNLRRLDLLDAATTFAWEQASAKGLGPELQPSFERIAAQLAVLRSQTAEFRDPGLWVLISVLGSTIVHVVAYVLLDGDLVKHDYAEGAIEAELSAVFERLGAPVPPPDPSRLKGKHNYGGRVAALIGSCGLYGLWWLYDVMVEGNRHFEHNWAWEDGLAQAVQHLAAPTAT